MFLIICEKQNAAQRIAAILSKGRAGRTFVNRVALYDFIDENKNDFKVMGLKGHVLNLDFPQEFNRWDKIDPKVLIQTEPIKTTQDHNIVTMLKKIANQVDEVIVATDYDREGELIGVEGLELVQSINPDVKISRARFSALTGQEVRHAFNNLTEVDFNLSSAAYSRQIIDLKWGAVLTRFISLASNQTGKDFLSVGRVQSPTLALIVDREKEIMDFKSKPYWEITAKLEKEQEFKAKHHTERFWEQEQAKQAHERAKAAKVGTITKLDIKEEIDYPPSPFNTTSFLRVATMLKTTAAKAMSIAEELYIAGFISYPRTDNTVYPSSINLRKILEMFRNTEFGHEASELLAQGKLFPSRGKVTATDHPPIHPVGVAKRSELKPMHWKVYELVVRRFFATVAPKAKAKVTRVEIDINHELFIGKGYKFIQKGWRKYYPYLESKERFLPELNVDDKAKVIEIVLEAKETRPPNRYSQGSLIQEMDKLGLGTKSTRHNIIQKLYSRGYITSTSPIPTTMGIAVSTALEKYAETITNPNMTATLEHDMDRIANGNIQMQDVVKESEEMLHEIVTVLEQNKNKIGQSILEALAQQNTIGKCSQCGGNLRMMKSYRGKRFIGCSEFPKCRNSYPLPQYGKIIPKSTTCKFCGAPEISVINSKKKPWHTCVNMKCERKNNNKKSTYSYSSKKH